MPQRHLPMFPAGVTHITDELAFERRDGKIAYFNGHMPVFVHAEDDVATFRMITSQFCESGYAKQCDIIRAFGVTSISVKRAVKLYRERGTKGFYAPRRWRGPAVLSAGVMAEIESLLVAGVSLAEVAQKLGLKLNTLQKAVSAGRICQPPKKDCGERIAASTKSQRSEIDCAAPMGRGATATLERMAASLGQIEEVELSVSGIAGLRVERRRYQHHRTNHYDPRREEVREGDQGQELAVERALLWLFFTPDSARFQRRPRQSRGDLRQGRAEGSRA